VSRARLLLSLGLLWLVSGAFAACGIDQTGDEDSATDVDSGTDSGKTKVGGGDCFPGSKVCPNAKGELVCLDSKTPDTGCPSGTACAPCVTPHATPTCDLTSGACAVATCDTGYQDCNGDGSDGCETNQDKDPSHCGDCFQDCILANGPDWLCDAGTCVQNTCVPTTTADCDGDSSDGCETDLVGDVNNCSYCGHVCALPHASAKCAENPLGNPLANCLVDTCDAGWANCDGNDANGCESSATTDPGSCGGCGQACSAINGVPGCDNGVCAIFCNPGFANCDGNVANGCEVDIWNDISNCGACSSICTTPGSTPVCTNGSCGHGTCGAGFDDCDGNPQNGCETNLGSDPAHCGSCGTACSAPPNGSAVCNAGVCGVSCSPGFASCGTSTCYDVSGDSNRCGPSCLVCPPPVNGNGVAACSAGACTVICNPPFSACGNGCYNLGSDNANCGGCSKPCNNPNGGTATCTSGTCKATCNPPLTACGAICANTGNDQSNCGGCGIKCSGLQFCSGASCHCYAGKTCGPGSCAAQCCGSSECGGKCCIGGWCCP
jgi:hypothetical protein